ncbi:MAG: hypothetical protein PHU42_03835 [Patescibacteria group bacterium]|nr:hypothetical protein [Patescibacteria group bacterium]
MPKENKPRKSIRLKDFNYSEPGDYFITICTQDRKCLFGEIVDGDMKLNEVGKIVEKCWLEIPEHFPNTELDIFQIMPNHIHFILRILEEELDEENNRIGCRDAIHRVQLDQDANQDAMNRVPTGGDQGGFAGLKSPMLNPNSLSKIIRWFKGRTTFEIHKMNIDFMWQSKFYDHIIRNEKSYDEIYTYIFSNPQTWDRDRNNPKNLLK